MKKSTANSLKPANAAVKGNRTDEKVTVQEQEKIEEVDGSMERSAEEKLMHSVVENDSQTINEGKLVIDAINAGLGNFTPDMMYEKLVNNFEEAEELYGETILREVTGFEPSNLDRNVRIPEFRRLLKDQMLARLNQLKEKGILDESYGITDQGFLLATLVLVKDELDHLLAAGFGRREQKERRDERSEDTTNMRRRYKDIDLRKTLALLAKRSHGTIKKEDLRFHEQRSEGKVCIMYCLDASGSMKGIKLSLAKRAGVALAYEAMRNGDDVGLLAFGSNIETTVPPGGGFMEFVHALVTLRAKRETNIASAIDEALPLLYGKSKHLVLLTDALHTTGNPEEVLAAAQRAKDAGVTVSIIGINLDKEGEKLSERVIDLTQGRFYRVQNLQEIDLLILEDYARLKR